jgi:hypothetical protein
VDYSPTPSPDFTDSDEELVGGESAASVATIGSADENESSKVETVPVLAVL